MIQSFHDHMKIRFIQQTYIPFTLCYFDKPGDSWGQPICLIPNDKAPGSRTGITSRWYWYVLADGHRIISSMLKSSIIRICHRLLIYKVLVASPFVTFDPHPGKIQHTTYKDYLRFSHLIFSFHCMGSAHATHTGKADCISVEERNCTG